MKRAAPAEATRPRTRSMDNAENAVALRGKAVQASKRRALGDIGNMQAAAAAVPKQAVDKAKDRAQQQQPKSNGDAVKDKPGKDDVVAPRRVTRSQTRALHQGPSAPAARNAAPTSRRAAQPAAPEQQAQSQQQPGHQQQPAQQLVPAQEQQQRAVLSPLPDIDGPDRHNPLAECQYVNDIYGYFRYIEPKYRAPANYMESQPDINEKMRAILIDWLVEVHLKFKLMPETLFLTVNLIDRFLNEKQVTRKNLQLVGVTAMLIASKYEEIWAPEVRDFVYISDRAYTKEQILGMEKVMLNTLKFHLTLPTTYNFLARDLKAANMHFDKDVTMLSSYLIELAQVDAGMLKNNYSLIAVAALHVSMCAYEKADCYPRALEKHCGYTQEEVTPVAMQLAELMQKAPTSSLTAVWKKYSSTKYNEAAKKPAPAHLLPAQPVA